MSILRMIFASGFGFVVTTVTGTILLCNPATSIVTATCTPLTPGILDAMVKAGFVLSGFVGVTSGAFVYYVTGKWKLN